MVFQLSKLCSLLLEAIRVVTGMPAWEVLVSGSIPGLNVDRHLYFYRRFSLGAWGEIREGLLRIPR